VHDVALLEQELRQVAAVLARDPLRNARVFRASATRARATPDARARERARERAADDDDDDRAY